MRFNALLVAAAILALGAVLSVAAVRESLGSGLDDTWQSGLAHAWLVLAPLFFLPARGGRGSCLDNLAGGAACAVAGFAAVLCFSFAAMQDRTWQLAALGGSAWLACTGVMALAARGQGRWLGASRAGLMCAMGLPALWHYLALEYSGVSTLHWRPLSPNWALATGDINPWPLLIAGALSWTAALALPERGES